MKKALGIILSVLVVVGLVFAEEWLPNNKHKVSSTTGFSWTNNAVGPAEVTGYLAKYGAAATGSVSFSISNSTAVTLILTSTLSSTTNLVLGKDIFDGLLIENGEVFVVADTCGGTSQVSLCTQTVR